MQHRDTAMRCDTLQHTDEVMDSEADFIVEHVCKVVFFWCCVFSARVHVLQS